MVALGVTAVFVGIQYKASNGDTPSQDHSSRAPPNGDASSFAPHVALLVRSQVEKDNARTCAERTTLEENLVSFIHIEAIRLSGSFLAVDDEELIAMHPFRELGKCDRDTGPAIEDKIALSTLACPVRVKRATEFLPPTPPFRA